MGKLEGFIESTWKFARAVGEDIKNLTAKIAVIIKDEEVSETSTYSSKVIQDKFNLKVDKEDGKGLSDENFTLEEKGKLAMGVVPYSGANKTVDLNTQNLNLNGKLQKGNGVLEISNFSGGSNNSFARLENIANWSVHFDTTKRDCIVIRIPMRNLTAWVMDVDIFSMSDDTIFPSPIKLRIKAYRHDNLYPLVQGYGGIDNVASVSFGRDSNQNTVLIIRSKIKNKHFSHGKVNIANFYYMLNHHATLDNKNNYSITSILESNLTDFTLNGTITNARFVRESYFATTNEINNIYDLLSAKANDRLSNVATNLSVTERNTLKEKIGIGDNLQVPSIKISTGFGYNNSAKEKRVRGSFWMNFTQTDYPEDYVSVMGNKELLIVDFPDFEKYQQQGIEVTLLMERYRGRKRKVYRNNDYSDKVVSYRKAGFRMESEKDLLDNGRKNRFVLTGQRTVVDMFPEKYFDIHRIIDNHTFDTRSKGAKLNSFLTNRRKLREPEFGWTPPSSFFVIAFRLAYNGNVSNHIYKMKCYCAVNSGGDHEVVDKTIENDNEYPVLGGDYAAKLRIFFDTF